MKVQEIIALFAEIEEKFPVDTWLIDDIHVWPLMRLDLMMNLNLSDSPKQQIQLNLFFKIRQALGMISGYGKYLTHKVRDYKQNAHLKKADIVFLGDGISRIFLQGRWFDRFCDPLIQTLQKHNRTSVMIEPLHNYHIPRYTPSMFIQPFLDFTLIKKMLFHKKKRERVQLKNFNEFLHFLKAKNLLIPLPDEGRIKMIVKVIKAYSEYYKKILKIVKPTLAFVVCYYGPRGLAFNAACRELGIPSVDLQHGVAGKSNAAYGQWNKIPKNGYETLPTLFWCWSKEDAKAIEQWNTNVKKWHTAFVGGNIFMQFWKKNGTQFEDFNQLMQSHKASVHILVTFSSVEDHNDILLKNILEVIPQSDQNWKWWIRLHPCLLHKKNDFKKIFKTRNITNVEIDQATNIPLAVLLNHMNLHITYQSATVMEAQLFQCPSIITAEDGLQYFSDQLSTGWAVYANTPSEIKKAIEVQLNKKKKLMQQDKTPEIGDILEKMLKHE